jgi:hypothetical protein
MRRGIIVVAVAGLLVTALSGTSVARDRPFSTAKLIAMKWRPAPEERDLGTGGGNTRPGWAVLGGADRAVPLRQRR